jgi:aerobic-type carbon monoxide dehydrogenase small subunit (CoxS/CutS family)
MGDSAMPKNMRLIVNGREQQLETEADRPLFDVLPEDLHLTGTKFGWGEGECGACTVLVEGTAVRSCVTAVSEVDGRQVRTIEGLASEGELHPLNRHFSQSRPCNAG